MSCASLNHDSVSCNVCGKNNFRGLRYKCLVCSDYDLCSQCYDSKQATSKHLVKHPVQCIVSRSEYEVYYSGEPTPDAITKSLTCPLCGLFGFTENTLAEHISLEHSSNESEYLGVICPICGIESGRLISDFPTHLLNDHKLPRDSAEPNSLRGGRTGRCHARSNLRGRRSQAHCGTSSINRDSTFVEILAQLSGARVSVGSNQSPASQLHQLSMHLQPVTSRSNDRDFSLRSSAQRPCIRQVDSAVNTNFNNEPMSPCSELMAQRMHLPSTNQSHFVLTRSTNMGSLIVDDDRLVSAIQEPLPVVESSSMDSMNESQLLLNKCSELSLSESEQHEQSVLRSDRQLFTQELIMQLGLLKNA